MLQISQNLKNTPVALSEDGHLVLLMRALQLQVLTVVMIAMVTALVGGGGCGCGGGGGDGDDDDDDDDYDYDDDDDDGDDDDVVVVVNDVDDTALVTNSRVITICPLLTLPCPPQSHLTIPYLSCSAPYIVHITLAFAFSRRNLHVCQTANPKSNMSPSPSLHHT